METQVVVAPQRARRSRRRRAGVAIARRTLGYLAFLPLARAYRLLQENPKPTEAEIRIGISGNLCRCTGYQNIVKAIQYAAAKIAGVPFQEAAE